jgi:Protein of unknown function DUF86
MALLGIAPVSSITKSPTALAAQFDFPSRNEGTRGPARDPQPGGGRVRAPWKHIVELRNSLTHEYLRVGLDSLWEFVGKELVELERDLRRLPK